ncbi:hypothetical protein HRR83_009248 [Exophiala dermatitidis]|uniref:Uncharacterized protein n=1 Tax=Exophiala dermatitidis (strain ATCC 34100 / CBS 525.76 / NIH/UT8656) TaxID=858893 RepID=H6BP00_EXODN|nr:uncharacterized protein HMPREF1120_00630 [Exophiala dermatitidis NIH/UT8656]KAJ4502535.1 hypothetical protein HRR73_009403 [Exophiala dermatitidis]EHY52418.1 hypothetical protein HMPREF1120_00630 [Exophiala dermatitidis NIH/UT8656]KAJ4503022.1 hypothetical protein HRR74_009411 [Exophiala dermatitidis]KAJ4531637.1 hypothetical protein HRR77_009288 [Exophiala dermatitidis]KAJ4548030.1 hypothetical protein HRR76_000648 [Exophiala dermatitidis]
MKQKAPEIPFLNICFGTRTQGTKMFTGWYCIHSKTPSSIDSTPPQPPRSCSVAGGSKTWQQDICVTLYGTNAIVQACLSARWRIYDKILWGHSPGQDASYTVQYHRCSAFLDMQQ